MSTRQKLEEIQLISNSLMFPEEAISVLDGLKTWLPNNYTQVLPKSKIAKAIVYSLSRWDRLSLCTKDGRLQLDDNTNENAMRLVALGRTNYLFAGSKEGGKRLALFYSLLASCKKQHVNPWKYIKDFWRGCQLRKLDNYERYCPTNGNPTSNVLRDIDEVSRMLT